MNSHGLTRENLVATLPPALQKDPSAVALAEAMADLLARRQSEIEQLRIYPVIDRLDEQLLDILAYDFKVDWWDAEYLLEEKRRTLKDSWRVHKTLGTKAAVETAIRAIYPRTKVLEWFEYGGQPYHFRLDINITNDSIDSAKQRRVLERLNFYKSLRSHNDGITYFVEAQPAAVKTVGCAPGVWETLCVPIGLPVPVIRSEASVRAWTAATGLLELATVRAELPIPIRATAHTGVTTVLREACMAQVTVPEGKMPEGIAVVQAATASAWQECYTTKIEEVNHGGTE